MSKVLSIRVTGAVQGIGYRPFIARLAEKLNLVGEVRNTGGVVTILAAGSASAVDTFLQTVQTKVPAGGLLVSVDARDVTDRYVAAEDKADVSSVAEEYATVVGKEPALDETEEHAAEALNDRKESDGILPLPERFRICESEVEQVDDLPVFPPDIGICEECTGEMEEPSDRRHGYPLISCASCGPRWSILRRFPYDRDTTAMLPYEMCPTCAVEYTTGRRRHAQTISCHDCGPQMVLYGFDGTQFFRAKDASAEKQLAKSDAFARTLVQKRSNEEDVDEDLMKAAEILRRGGILAAKSVGGYQLMCLANDADAAKRLRKIKGREKKPFAVLFHDVSAVKEYCIVNEEEEKLLRSSARPIVLLEPAVRSAFPAEVCAESRRIGAFLASAGFQTLLTGLCGPLIVTSCNLTDGPILTHNEDLLTFFRQSEDPPDAVYDHDREILRPLDDSVLSVVDGQAQMIRRSRGYVPMPVFVKHGAFSGTAILALGGDLKSTFCLMKRDRAILSQYYGDLAEYGVYGNYTHGIRDMADVFEVKPEIIVTDLHPGYLSSAHGKEIAEELAAGGTGQVKEIRVQHHHAHIASVMAEHGLESCIGIAFDGTGYGTDGQLWGGEFLYCKGSGFEREASLSAIRLCGGDRAAKDAELAACCLITSCENAVDTKLAPDRNASIVEGTDKVSGSDSNSDFFLARQNISPAKAQMVRAALAHNINTVSCTSMGRLFDAAAFLLGLRAENSYEGECAIALENAAIRAAKSILLEDNANAGADSDRTEFSDVGAAGNETETVNTGTPGNESDLIHAILERADLWRRVEMLFPELVREEDGRLLLSQEVLARGIMQAMQEESADLAALLFHMAILEGSVQICRKIRAKTGETAVALSGGSFQNRILAEGCVHLLRNEGFHVYLNRLVPPNDGGISLGQAFIAAQTLRK